MAVSMGPNGITLGTSTKSDWSDVGGGVSTDVNGGVGTFMVGNPNSQFNSGSTNASFRSWGFVNGSDQYTSVGGTWRNVGRSINSSGRTSAQRIA